LRYAGEDLSNAELGPGARPFAWVPQDAMLVTGTILDNVALWSGDEEHARAALEAVGAHALLARATDRVGPGGRALSGGERRLVAIARALASGSPVLLLDEPTEGLDPDAEAAVLSALVELRGTRTLIVVSHRPSVAAIADERLSIAPSPGSDELAAQ
jgi:ABC-type multidrug transport system fused ATPase/permease subunit